MYVCLCVFLFSRADVPRVFFPTSNKGFWGAKWRGGEAVGLARMWRSVHRDSSCVSECTCVLLGSRRCWWCLISIVQISKFNMYARMFFVTHALCACSKPDLGWCHMQLLRGWRTVSAPQHGALWSACQADWQVNDTNESQPSLPLWARHWVAASKQPKRASLNLKVISLPHSLSLFLHCSSLFLLLLGLPFLLLSLALSHLLTLFSNKSLSLFFSLHGYFSLALKASVYFHYLSSSPLFLPFTLSVTAQCCFLALCHQDLRSS